MSRQFTTEAEKALNKAAKFAIRMGQRIVGSEHLLFGLSAAPGVAAKVLKENGMDKERLDIEVREYCGNRPKRKTAAFPLPGGSPDWAFWHS